MKVSRWHCNPADAVITVRHELIMIPIVIILLHGIAAALAPVAVLQLYCMFLLFTMSGT